MRKGNNLLGDGNSHDRPPSRAPSSTPARAAPPPSTWHRCPQSHPSFTDTAEIEYRVRMRPSRAVGLGFFCSLCRLAWVAKRSFKKIGPAAKVLAASHATLGHWQWQGHVMWRSRLWDGTGRDPFFPGHLTHLKSRFQVPVGRVAETGEPPAHQPTSNPNTTSPFHGQRAGPAPAPQRLSGREPLKTPKANTMSWSPCAGQATGPDHTTALVVCESRI